MQIVDNVSSCQPGVTDTLQARKCGLFRCWGACYQRGYTSHGTCPSKTRGIEARLQTAAQNPRLGNDSGTDYYRRARGVAGGLRGSRRQREHCNSVRRGTERYRCARHCASHRFRQNGYHSGGGRPDEALWATGRSRGSGSLPCIIRRVLRYRRGNKCGWRPGPDIDAHREAEEGAAAVPVYFAGADGFGELATLASRNHL